MAYSGAANLSMFSRRSIYSNTRFSHSKFTCSICYFIICVNERHAYDVGSRQHVNYVADINGHKMTWRKQETPLQAVWIKLTEFVFCSSEIWQGEPNLEVNLWVKNSWGGGRLKNIVIKTDDVSSRVYLVIKKSMPMQQETILKNYTILAGTKVKINPVRNCCSK